ncbi:MAG TPA: lmo0937 family membrane protein [Pseudogracilibacillus sp.]|nr:lmo0937 family membrane protein [Pseudogracilibacillus sp.]
MLWTILGILIVLWLIGFIFKIAGGLIHLLLLLAVIILIIRFIMYLVDA